MIEQILVGVKADPTIAGIIDTRMYYRDPIGVQAGAYITFLRQDKQRFMASENNRFIFTCFSTDFDELEALTIALIDYFEDRFEVGTDEYFKIALLASTDSVTKLQSGFFFNTATFEFKNSR